jgi:hypothetical protein
MNENKPKRRRKRRTRKNFPLTVKLNEILPKSTVKAVKDIAKEREDCR